MARLVFHGSARQCSEVVTVTADERGLRIDVLYDGVHALDVKPAISWAEIDALRWGVQERARPSTPSRV